MGKLSRAELEAKVSALYKLLGTFDARNHRDFESICAMMTEDVYQEIPFMEKPILKQGRPAVRAFMESMQGMFSSIEYTFNHFHYDVDNQSVVVEVVGERASAKTQQKFKLRYVFAFQFRDGLICAMREYVNPFDTAAIIKAYGAPD